MENKVYWIERAGPAPAVPQADVPAACDAAVIGGGLTGLSTALHLARRGAAVHLFEQSAAGEGASMRNGGMTLAGLKLSPGHLLEKFGLEKAVRLYRASLEAIDFVEAFVQREGLECDFRRSGVIWAACTPGHYQGFAEAQRVLRDTYQHETFLVDRAKLPEELGSPAYHGALVDPLSAGLDPARLTRGLLRLALEAGVQVHERTPVTAVRRQAAGFELETPRGTTSAGRVVVGTNGYTPACLPGLRRRVIPIGSYILVTEPLPPEVAGALIPRQRMVFDSKKFLFYFRRVEGNRLLFGGRTSFRRIDDASAARRLQQGMLSVFPQLQPYRVEYYWSGNVAFTFDELPHLGQMDGLYYALGYCGHGVAMSLYAGQALAGMVSGEPARLPLAELDFPGRFFYWGVPWFLPLAGWYYGWLDRLAR